jgi:hypothetical protein
LFPFTHLLFRTLIIKRKTSRYIAGSFFNDTTGMFKTRVNDNSPGANGDGQATSTLQVAMTAGPKTQWLMLCRPQGVVEVRCHVMLSISLPLPFPFLRRSGPFPN